MLLLPEGRHIIIDAKMTLIDYQRACETLDDGERERHINMHMSPEVMAGVYANFANVSHSDYEFTITFARLDHEIEDDEIPGVVVSRVSAAPQFMRELIDALEQYKPELDRDLPPVAIGHGTYDPIIDVEFSRRARDLLEAAGAEVTYRESPMPHTIDPQFAAELPAWIRQALPAAAPDAR